MILTCDRLVAVQGKESMMLGRLVLKTAEASLVRTEDGWVIVRGGRSGT